MSSSIIVHDTVKILVETILPLDRTSLASYLGIPRGKVSQWDDMYRTGTLTFEELITRFLEHWVSRNGETATVTALVTILRENEFMAAADSLCCPSNTRTFSFGVKKPLINFVGRVSEIEELTKWLQNGTSKAFLISGIGGQGKTELSRRFIQTLTPGSTVVTWFKGDDATQLENSLNDCSSSINLPTKDYNGNPISIINLVKNIGKFVSKITGPDCLWLAVIDNVDEDYKEFLPAVHELLENDAYILVTSRITNILPPDSGFKNLEELKEEDSVTFVNKVLGKTEPKDVTDLCKELQNHALALQQAIAYIKCQQRKVDSSYGINEFLKVFNQDTEESFGQQLGLSGYDRTMSKIVEMTINKLIEIDGKDEKSVLLFLIASCLNPDGIPLKFLKDLFSLNTSEIKFDNAKETLIILCMIRVDKNLVSIHRVVQILARNKIKSQFLDFHQKMLNNTISKIDIQILTREEMRHFVQLYKINIKELLIVQHENCFDNIYIKLLKLALFREVRDMIRALCELSFTTNLSETELKNVLMIWFGVLSFTLITVVTIINMFYYPFLIGSDYKNGS